MERDATLGSVRDISIMSDHNYCRSLSMKFLEKRHDLVAGVAIKSARRLIG
jgi:hypothetical protein